MSAPADADLLDINSAYQGPIGRTARHRREVFGRKIIDGRPYAKKTDLTRRRSFPPLLRQDQRTRSSQAKVV